MQELMSNEHRDFHLAGHPLQPQTLLLLNAFHVELADKLRRAEIKHGYRTDWRDPDNIEAMKQGLFEHIAKGDPRDVAAFCMFLWFHEETTKKEGATE
jgi:hypothetical protein